MLYSGENVCLSLKNPPEFPRSTVLALGACGVGVAVPVAVGGLLSIAPGKNMTGVHEMNRFRFKIGFARRRLDIARREPFVAGVEKQDVFIIKKRALRPFITLLYRLLFSFFTTINYIRQEDYYGFFKSNGFRNFEWG